MKPIKILAAIVIVLAIVVFCLVSFMQLASAAYTEPLPEQAELLLQTDYADLMITCCLSGDTETGREAAERRNEKIDLLGLTYVKVDFDELWLLSKIITAEAGSDWLSDEWKMAVGEVLLNRVESPEFPDSVAEVIYQPLQYYDQSNHYFQQLLPFERCVDIAWRLLNGERVLNDPSVVFQANFTQGSGTALVMRDRRLGTTYFCYSSYPELYKEACDEKNV